MKGKSIGFLKISNLFILSGGNVFTKYEPTDPILTEKVRKSKPGLIADLSSQNMLNNFVSKHQGIAFDKRQKELSLLKTPVDRAARQEKTRSQLDRYFSVEQR